VLVASDLRISPTAVSAVTVGLGVLHGFFNGAAMRPAGTGVMELVGVMATVFLLVAPVAAFVVSLKPPWTRIVVRVAGSWIAAIGLLLLGWSMREAWKGSNARMAMLPGRQATAMAEPSAVQLTGKSERAKGKPRRGWRERQTVGHAASKTRVNGKRADLRKPGPAEAPLSQDETLA
jgi:hypothetical protein